MNRTPVQSHNLKSVGYDNGTLELEFVTGRVYQYFDVSPLVHGQLMSAESAGKYFAEYIRDRYEHREIDVPKFPDFTALVESVPGAFGWRHGDGRDVFQAHAERLYTLGITDLDMLRRLLHTLYLAVATEYRSEDELRQASPCGCS